MIIYVKRQNNIQNINQHEHAHYPLPIL